MRLPEIQQALLNIAHAMALQRKEHAKLEQALRDLIPQINRRKHSRGRDTSRPMTPEIEAEIWRLHYADPNRSGLSIAKEVGVSQGRVSVVLYGRRT